MFYPSCENRSIPKPKPKRKKIHVEPRHVKLPEELEVAANTLFLGNTVHVEIVQPKVFRRLASFRLWIDYIAIAYGFKRKYSVFVKQLEEEVERAKKIEMPEKYREESNVNEEDEDKSVPCGLLFQGGEIKGTEREVTDENDVEGIVPDIAEILLTFDSDYLDAVIGKNECGEPYLYIKDAYSELDFYVQRISTPKKNRKKD